MYLNGWNKCEIRTFLGQGGYVRNKCGIKISQLLRGHRGLGFIVFGLDGNFHFFELSYFP